MSTKFKQAKKINLLVLVLAALLLLAACGNQTSSSTPAVVNEASGSSSLAAVPSSSSIPPQPVEHRVSFSAVGDNLIHSSIYEQANKRAGGQGYSFDYLYENIRPYLAEHDVNWINQESLITNLAPSTYPTFSTPEELGHSAYDAGWRVFGVSNNHTYDKGAAGIAATRQFWAGMPDDALTAGLYQSENTANGIAVHEVNGLTIAYVAFTESTNGLPTPSGTEAFVIYTSETDAMQALVSTARNMADVVVVGVHWGVEYSHTPTDAQRQLAQSFTEWGADVIIGTHPHVIQPVEWVDGGGRQALVAYSLGNFISAQDRAPRMVGLALSFDLVQVEQPDGTREALAIENVQVRPAITHYDSRFANIRSYLFRDYTEELATAHGVRSNDPSFSIDYIRQLVETHISPEFLVLD